MSRMRGHAMLAIRMTEGAFYGKPKKDEGHYFCIDSHGCITGYRVQDGEIADLFGGGSYDSEIFLKRLRAIDFQAFDYPTEIQNVYTREKEKAEKEGEQYIQRFVLDGAEYEITYDFEGVHFLLRAWNPGCDIDFCAERSPRIAKLKALLDLFYEYYGRSKIGL